MPELQRVHDSRPHLSVSQLVALTRRPGHVTRTLTEHFSYDSDEELFRFLRERPAKKSFFRFLKGKASHDNMWNRWLEFLDHAQNSRHSRVSPATVVEEVEDWVADRVHAKKGYSGNARCCNATIAMWTRCLAKVWCVIREVRYVSNNVTFPGSD